MIRVLESISIFSGCRLSTKCWFLSNSSKNDVCFTEESSWLFQIHLSSLIFFSFTSIRKIEFFSQHFHAPFNNLHATPRLVELWNCNQWSTSKLPSELKYMEIFAIKFTLMTSNAVEAIVEYLGAESKNDSLHWECITLETQFSSTIDKISSCKRLNC